MAEDIPEGPGRLPARRRSTCARPAPRSTSCRASRASSEFSFFGFPDESDAPYVIELIRTPCIADDDGSRPLYAAVGIYAATGTGSRALGRHRRASDPRLVPAR